MAKNLYDLPLASTLGNDDLLYAVQGGTNDRKARMRDLHNFLQPRLGAPADGINWRSRSAPAISGSAFSVAFGNGVFVAVGVSSAYRSTNGVEWSKVTMPSGTFFGVTYGNGLFVACGVGAPDPAPKQAIATSPDGITWTLRTTPNLGAGLYSLYSVAYGGGLYSAMIHQDDNASGTAAITSPDGITWTARTVPFGSIGHTSIAYGNGRFVAMRHGYLTANTVYSTDGVTWNYSDISTRYWTGVAYGAGRFVAVCKNGTEQRVITSPDGITWAPSTSPADYDWQAVTFGSNMFVAIANSGTGQRIATSPDGITWTLRTTPVDGDWKCVTYGNGLFVAIANSGTDRVMTNGSPEVL